MNISQESLLLINQTKKSFESLEGCYKRDDLLIPKFGLSMKVTNKMINRSIRFMKTFIELAEKRNFKIYIKNAKTCISIIEEELEVSCREKLKWISENERKKKWQSYYPTGLLTFNLEGYYQRQWIDGTIMLEQQTEKILDKLEGYAQKKRATIQAVRESMRVREEERKKQEEIRRIEELEVLKFAQLLESSKRFKEIGDILEFIENVKKHHESNKEGNILDWVDWSLKKVNEYRIELLEKMVISQNVG